MVAIITGSDSGIGKATAVALARRGHDIGITYSRDEDGAEATAEEVRAHARRAELRHLDLADADGVQRRIDELAQALGRLDILVNNAGSGSSTRFLELDPAEWRDVLAVDLTGAFLAGQAAARRMVQAGVRGRIVNVPPCTSTCRCGALRRTSRPSTVSAASRKAWRSSWPSTASPSTPSRRARSPRP
jgi:NAD(P)-dependent dehydrogenase (short-subunit alcohol dehydrogenase family)